MKRWFVVIGVWIGFGLLYATWLRVQMSIYIPAFDWTTAFKWAFPDAALWALLSVVPIKMSSHMSLFGPHLRRNIVAHALVLAAIAALHSALDAAAGFAMGSYAREGLWGAMLVRLRESFPSNLMIYAVVVGVCHYIQHGRRLRAQEHRAAELTAQLSEARLRALHMQLRPHFLMNAMHTVAGLIDQDRRAAKRVIRQLGEILRASLATDQRGVVTLREEIDFIRAYLDIEMTRFEDRLYVDIAVDEDCMDINVPVFLLQPIVENAVWHGISPKLEGGNVRIHGRCINGRLVLEVTDDGPGLAARVLADNEDSGWRTPLGSQAPSRQDSSASAGGRTPTGGRSSADANGTGIGLSNTRARLRTLYGEKQELTLENMPAGGLRVQLSIPAHRSDTGASVS